MSTNVGPIELPEMVLIPAGWFLRGSSDKDPSAHDNEKPQRRVYLSDYYIGKYPVTNAEYAEFVRAMGHRLPYVYEHWAKLYNWNKFSQSPPAGRTNHPVVLISWDDAVAYCLWLSEVTGKDYHLPTEAQWEKAARGTDERIYPWGNRWDESRCNCWESGIRDTTPVGRYSPQGDSLYGCADMAGNVWEWCADWYARDYYRTAPDRDPTGPESGQYKVVRGGSFVFSGPAASRTADRYFSFGPADRLDFFGFRCAQGSLK